MTKTSHCKKCYRTLAYKVQNLRVQDNLHFHHNNRSNLQKKMRMEMEMRVSKWVSKMRVTHKNKSTFYKKKKKSVKLYY